MFYSSLSDQGRVFFRGSAGDCRSCLSRPRRPGRPPPLRRSDVHDYKAFACCRPNHQRAARDLGPGRALNFLLQQRRHVQRAATLMQINVPVTSGCDCAHRRLIHGTARRHDNPIEDSPPRRSAVPEGSWQRESVILDYCKSRKSMRKDSRSAKGMPRPQQTSWRAS